MRCLLPRPVIGIERVTRRGAHVVPVIGTIETSPTRSRAEAAIERQRPRVGRQGFVRQPRSDAARSQRPGELLAAPETLAWGAIATPEATARATWDVSLCSSPLISSYPTRSHILADCGVSLRREAHRLRGAHQTRRPTSSRCRVAVQVYRRSKEDDEDPDRPGDRLPQPVGDRSPSSRLRTAVMVTLRGWLRANGCSHPGIVWTGTTALLANMRMKNGRIPATCAVSGSFVASPMVA